MSRLVIYGVGGFGREVLLAARAETRKIVFASDTPASSFAGIPVVMPAQIQANDEVVIAIADGDVRRQIAGRPYRWGRVIAPTVVIGAEVQIGEGAIFFDFVAVTTATRIGKHCQCGGYAYIAHDCLIGDFVTFGPRAGCNGNVRIGDGAQIGAGSVIRQGLPERPVSIGERAVVGMGAVVTKDVAAFATVIGNPAKPLA